MSVGMPGRRGATFFTPLSLTVPAPSLCTLVMMFGAVAVTVAEPVCWSLTRSDTATLESVLPDKMEFCKAREARFCCPPKALPNDRL